MQLLKQEALHDDQNLIAINSVREWQRDVVSARSVDDVVSMLVGHYSLVGDQVWLDGEFGNIDSTLLGRRISLLNDSTGELPSREYVELTGNPFFKRFGNPQCDFESSHYEEKIISGVHAISGNSKVILQNYAETFDGAVTSPPYYNAREYSKWENVYCYMNEMMEVGLSVFNSLKPGALYLYNIFDYFDNENNISGYSK